jgi:SAM-dependent methyltransferase
MAEWLAEHVGPTGHVVATDVDTRDLARLEIPNLEVIEHDIREDPLATFQPGSFDLVCSRLMLFHLRGRQEQAIRQMVACLRPGGWLVDEDANWGTAGAPVDPGQPRYDDYQRVWQDGDRWASRGYDKVFGPWMNPYPCRPPARIASKPAGVAERRRASVSVRWLSERRVR